MDWGALATIVSAALTFISGVLGLMWRAAKEEAKQLRGERDSAEAEAKRYLGMLFILAQGSDTEKRQVIRHLALRLQGDQQKGFYPDDG